MQAARLEALNIIGQVPEDSDMDEIMYRLYVLGKTITSEELQREIDSW